MIGGPVRGRLRGGLRVGGVVIDYDVEVGAGLMPFGRLPVCILKERLFMFRLSIENGEI